MLERFLINSLLKAIKYEGLVIVCVINLSRGIWTLTGVHVFMGYSTSNSTNYGCCHSPNFCRVSKICIIFFYVRLGSGFKSSAFYLTFCFFLQSWIFETTLPKFLLLRNQPYLITVADFYGVFITTWLGLRFRCYFSPDMPSTQFWKDVMHQNHHQNF